MLNKMSFNFTFAVMITFSMQMDEKKYLFDKKTLRTTELLILSTLNWRMQAITPFSYIDFFLNKVNGDQVPIGDSILQSFRLIMSTVRGNFSVFSFLIIFMIAKNEMIMWNGFGIQCRTWLHSVQTIWNCSSCCSASICGGWKPNCSNWESTFSSHWICRKGTNDGPMPIKKVNIIDAH